MKDREGVSAIAGTPFLEAKNFVRTYKCIDYKHPEDDDMVCIFLKCTLDNCTSKVFDLYRLENEKLAEYWDCIMHVDGMMCNDLNGQF